MIESGSQMWNFSSRGATKAKASPKSTCDAGFARKYQQFHEAQKVGGAPSNDELVSHKSPKQSIYPPPDWLFPN